MAKDQIERHDTTLHYLQQMSETRIDITHSQTKAQNYY